MARSLLIFFLIMVSCSPWQEYYHYRFDTQAASSIKTVMVTPVDMIRERPKGSSRDQIDNLDTTIVEYLKKHGFVVVPNMSLSTIWDNEVSKIGGFFDPATGAMDAGKIGACLARTVEKTRQVDTFDALIFVQIVEREAKLSGDRVYWDGCGRKLLDDRGNVLTDFVWNGRMRGLSLQVQLFDAHHRLVFQNIGAIEFPFEFRQNFKEQVFVWKDSLTFETPELAEAIGIAFHPLIPYSRYPPDPHFYEE